MWGLARSVASTLAEAFLSLADMPTDDGRAPHGPALTTSAPSKPNGAATSEAEFRAMLERRALMKGNRQKEAAAAYLDRHMSLFSAIYSGREP